jgi:hypothetical protein
MHSNSWADFFAVTSFPVFVLGVARRTALWIAADPSLSAVNVMPSMRDNSSGV